MKRNILILNVILLLLISNKSYSQWETLYSPLEQIEFPNVRTISFSDSLNGFGIGRSTMAAATLNQSSTSSSIIKTIDGGLTWEDVYITDTFQLNDIIHTNPSIIYCVGSSGSHGIIAKTIDSGQNWDTTIVSHGLSSISFPSDSIGYACGGPGVVLKTINYGQDWSIINNILLDYPYRCHFVNDSVGLILANTGIYNTEIYKTIDGGINWTAQPIPIGNLNAFTFSSDSIGYYAINSDDGNQVISIYKTTDCGEQWNQISTFTGMSSSSMNFTSDSVGYIVGQFVVKKTVDGGYNWVNQIANPPGLSIFYDDIHDVFFVDSIHGFIAGNNQFYRTNIGGGTPYLNTNELYNSDVEIYPNPFINEIKVDNLSSAYYHLKIFSISGSLLFQREINNETKIHVNVSKLPKGLYILTLFSDIGVKNYKIVKE